MTSPSESLTIEPSGVALRGLLDASARPSAAIDGAPPLLGRSIAEWRLLTRRELGLPESGPVVLSGHQAAFWHPGIVVKSMLADCLARSSSGRAGHVVVEQDIEPVAEVAVPILTSDGGLARTVVSFLRQPKDVVAGALPAFEPAAVPELRDAVPGMSAALGRIRSALETNRAAPNAAVQVTRAAFELLPLIEPPILIGPAALLDTTLARAVLAHMAHDPVAAATTYNAALDPDTATPLRILDDRVEMPLWRIDAAGASAGHRLRAWDDDLHRFREGAVRLMPRALLMTGLLRLAACDLFIHGSGGITYDAAMERWLRTWLGAQVAPAALATATMRLPLSAEHATAPDLAAARRAWREGLFDPEGLAPHAKHLGRPGPEKRGHLTAIDALPRGSAPRRRAWRAMHARLEHLREERADALDVRRAVLASALRARRERPIIDDRTWASPLHGLDRMAELLGSVQRVCA